MPQVSGAPQIPRFWEKSIEGALHSVTVAHSQLINPAEINAIGSEFRLH